MYREREMIMIIIIMIMNRLKPACADGMHSTHNMIIYSDNII